MQTLCLDRDHHRARRVHTLREPAVERFVPVFGERGLVAHHGGGADQMEGPFELPADTRAGDYIEIGMLGAYGAAMKTAFNGFGTSDVHEASDEPMASQYRGDRRDPRVSDNVVSLR